MQSGSDSSDSRYDNSAAPRPRNRARLTVVLTYIGLSINVFVILAGAWALPSAGILNVLILPLLFLFAITGLTVNVLAVVFGRSVVRADIPPEGKAACRVWVVVALVQVLIVLALTVAGVVWLPGLIYPPHPTSSTPATFKMSAEGVQRP